jgi:hypothetical protein
MKTYNPSIMADKLTHHMRVWVQSVHETLNNGVDMGTPKSSHPLDGSVNAGVYNVFDKGNSSGVLIRVAASGSTGTGAPYSWPASGSLKIAHGLLRQPIGFKIVDKDKTVDVFRTAPPDKDFITLAPTDKTASVTLYIF